MRVAQDAIGAGKPHCDAVGFAGNVEHDLLALQPYGAAMLALHLASRQLAGNLPLALAEHMVDGGRNRRQPARDLALRGANRQTPSEIPRQ